MDEKRASRREVEPSAVLRLNVSLSGSERYDRVRLDLDFIRLRRADGRDVRLDLDGKRVELRARQEFTGSLSVAVPAGEYDGAVLVLESVSALSDRDDDWQEVGGHAHIIVGDRFEVRPSESVETSVRQDLPELVSASVPDRGLEEEMEHWHAIESSSHASTIRLRAGSVALGRRGWAEIQLRPETFEPGTAVRLRRARSDLLPQLLRGQRVLGPVLEIEATRAPSGWLGITLSYSPEELAAAGLAPSDIVVLQLLRDQRRYRQLFPHHVDAARQTVSVRVSTLSAFFPCSPGIMIDLPRLRIDRAGERIAYTDARETQVTGRLADDRATALLLSHVARSSWSSQGFFVFEGVPLDRSDTRITLGAGVGSFFEHICEITVRRALPVKTVARPNTPFAGTPGFGEDGTTFVATVLRQAVNAGGVEGIDSLRRFLESIERNVPTMFWFNADSDQWQSFRLLTDRFHENEMARLAIDEIARTMQRQVPIVEAYPEDVRYLRSLADFVAAFDDPNARFGLAIVINATARLLGADNLTCSPRIPILTLEDDHVGCAFVCASRSGWQSTRRSSITSFLRRRHVPRRDDRRAEFGLSVLAGRLFYVRASPNGIASTEVVSDDIVCGAVALRANPRTGQPAILAIGLPPDDASDHGAGALLLFERQEDGSWDRRVVLRDQPIIDADMTYRYESLPHVVAAVEDRNEALNADLRYLVPRADDSGWTDEPLTWSMPGFPANTTLGMWPRIEFATTGHGGIPDVACVFAFFTEDRVTWLGAVEAGTRPDGTRRWRVTELGNGTRASLSGAPTPTPPRGFADDVVGFSRTSSFHWAPSIAPAPDGSLWVALGSGTLHLARFDGVTIDDRIIDIDRAIGFLPQLAVRTRRPAFISEAPPGTPAIAYKDVHGAGTFNAASGVELATGLDLHLFDLATSHQVPLGDPPSALAPRHTYTRAFIGDFGSRVPFTCGRFTEYAGIVGLVGPLVEIFGGGTILSRAEQRRILDETQASIFLNSPIDIVARPGENLVEITIRNDRPGEPDAIRSMRLRQRGGGRATLIVTDSDGNEGEGACGLSQDSWDTIANDFINLPIDPAGLFPAGSGVDVREARVEGIRISILDPGRPVPTQQGAMRFRIDLPSIRLEGRAQGVGFTAVSTEPSFFTFDVAPFVADGSVQWYIRSAAGRIGHIDVDVNLGFVTWIGIVAGILTGNPLLFLLAAVDPVVGSFATDATNDELARRQGLPLGGLPAQLASLLGAHALRKAFGAGSDASRFMFEAVHLQDRFITYFLRTRRVSADAPPSTLFRFFPQELRSYGSVVVGEASGVRNVLLENAGSFPVSLEDVHVAGSTEFVLVTPPTWPKIIAPGHAETVGLRFQPAGIAGVRQATLRALYNAHEHIELVLNGFAEPPPVPAIRVVPRQLSFGVVNVGSTATLQLTVSNDGAAPLTLDQLRIDGPDSALFGLPGQAPGSVPPGQSAIVNVSFTPAAMVAGGHNAVLVIESNADNDPQLNVSLFGAGAASNLLVMPVQIAFNPSPLAAELPPGLGSRRGFTIYNVGVAPLTIPGTAVRVLDAASSQLSAHYQLLDAAGQPFPQNDVLLAGGQYQAFSVQFRPVTAGDHPARIEITTTDQAQLPVTLSITGYGVQ